MIKNKTILVVDDDFSVLHLVEKILSIDNYTNINTAFDPHDAITNSKNINTLDLLITDIWMLDLNGFELAKEILFYHPRMKILYMSGHMKSQINKHNFSMNTYNFIQKPFNIQDFLEKVKTILEES